MKHLFTLIISVSLFLDISAQIERYQPMLVEGAVWDIGNVNGATTCGYNLNQSFRYEIGGDTLIDNQSYKYFYRYPLVTGHNELCEPYWVEDNKKELYTGAFLREDTVEKKVYIYYNGYYYTTDPFEHKEYLLYDFSLNIGDTLKSAYIGDHILHPPVLSEIRYNTLENGKEIKSYYFDNLEYDYSEQIGWHGGLFSSISLHIQEGYRSIYCEANDVVLLSNGWWINNTQEYLQLIENTNKYWDIGHWSSGSICGYDKHPRRYFMDGDTIIADKTYNKVYFYDLLPSDSTHGHCPPYYVNTQKKKANFGIREDTTQQKLFRYNYSSEGELLLFDCSLAEGDTITDSNFNACIIDSIRIIKTADNIPRKHFYITAIDIEFANGQFIEGIGGSQGPFQFPLGLDYEFGTVILCLNNEGSYIYGAFCNDIETGTIETLDIHNSIYPTVAKDYITIEINDCCGEAKVELLNMSGSVCSTFLLTDKKSKVDVSALLPGLYIAKIYITEKPVAIKKFNKM